jgi:hypothetical protein
LKGQGGLRVAFFRFKGFFGGTYFSKITEPAGRNLLVNSISTVFGKRGKVTEREIEIFRSKKTNPQQAALLKRPNSSQYPSIGDSDCKNTTKN